MIRTVDPDSRDRMIGSRPRSWADEAIDGANQLLANPGIGSVAGVINNHGSGARPNSLELPRVGDRRLEVKSAVDQDSGDVRQGTRIPQKNSVF